MALDHRVWLGIAHSVAKDRDSRRAAAKPAPAPRKRRTTTARSEAGAVGENQPKVARAPRERPTDPDRFHHERGYVSPLGGQAK